jgi:hypothetical protein
MSNNMWRGLAAAICLAVASVGPAHADGNNPVGTWLITVTFPDNPAGPPAPPPFKEFLTLHHNGTLTETNTTLHAHPVPGSPLAITASEGFGAWERAPGGLVHFTFLKPVFCGPEFDGDTFFVLGTVLQAPPPYDCSVPNLHLGYLRVRAQATFRGDSYSGGESWTELRIGPDPDAPLRVLPFGAAASEGKRIRVSAN